jgi:hypothetical protein
MVEVFFNTTTYCGLNTIAGAQPETLLIVKEERDEMSLLRS